MPLNSVANLSVHMNPTVCPKPGGKTKDQPQHDCPEQNAQQQHQREDALAQLLVIGSNFRKYRSNREGRGCFEIRRRICTPSRSYRRPRLGQSAGFDSDGRYAKCSRQSHARLMAAACDT